MSRSRIVRYALSTATVVSIVAGPIITAPPASASFLGKPGNIFVSAHKPGSSDYDIWQITPGGALVENQTGHNNTRDLSPVVSPEGGPHIVFVGKPNGGGEGDIYVVDRDSPGRGNPKIDQLTNSPADDEEPTWAPSGGKIAWARAEGKAQPVIWTMSLLGAKQEALRCCRGDRVQDTIKGSEPSWSPDSNLIAYVDPNRRIMLATVDRREAPKFVTQGTSPNWSPLGERLAFIRNGSLWVHNFDTDKDILVDARPSGAPDESPAWAPDSFSANNDLIVFSRGDDVFTVPPRAGATERRIGTSLVATHPDWMPDCNKKGSDGRDKIEGTDQPELLCGREGDDVIDGNGGSDRIFAGEGDDVVNAGPGNDFVLGGQGGDSNVIYGGPGNDHLEGGYGDDKIFDTGRNSGVDEIQGQPGNDIIHGDDGDPRNGDIVDGGEGHDTCWADIREAESAPYDFVWECEGLTVVHQLV